MFPLIERLVVDGDEYVSNLGVIGYLEGFQMQAVTGRGLDPEADFARWLRPTSQAYWTAINRLWEEEHPSRTSRRSAETSTNRCPLGGCERR